VRSSDGDRDDYRRYRRHGVRITRERLRNARLREPSSSLVQHGRPFFHDTKLGILLHRTDHGYFHNTEKAFGQDIREIFEDWGLLKVEDVKNGSFAKAIGFRNGLQMMRLHVAARLASAARPYCESFGSQSNVGQGIRPANWSFSNAHWKEGLLKQMPLHPSFSTSGEEHWRHSSGFRARR